MIRNYLKTVLRLLLLNRVFSLINILGLAIGLCAFILVSLYVIKEYSFDKQWENSDRIFWITKEIKYNDLISKKAPYMPFVAMPYVREYFPDEIEYAARTFWGPHVLRDRRFEGYADVYLIEREFLDIFKFDVVYGSLEETLQDPRNIALSEEWATLYFGNETPIGKTVTVEQEENHDETEFVDYVVTGVYRIPEGESSLAMPAFTLLDEEALTELGDTLTRWDGSVSINYFLLKEGVDVDRMNARLIDFVDQYVTESDSFAETGSRMSEYETYLFENLSATHFDANILGVEGVKDKDQVHIVMLIGTLVLIIACTNFVILTTAKAYERRHEVGVRKVLGANTSQLVAQFIAESLFFTGLALILALSFTELLLPAFSAVIGQSLSLEILDPMSLLSLFALVLLVGLASGAHPAWVMANFIPQKAVKGTSNLPLLGSVNLRLILVVLQFCITIILIVTTVTMYLQLSFIRNRDPGFNQENFFIIEMLYQGPSPLNKESLVNEILRLPGVEQAVLSSRQPNDNSPAVTKYTVLFDQQNASPVDSEATYVGVDFFDIYGIPLLAGRTYDISLDTPLGSLEYHSKPVFVREKTSKIIINRYLANSLGFTSADSAIGQVIQKKDTDYDGNASYSSVEIIGVVENSQFLLLRNRAAEEYYLFSSNYSTILTVSFHNSIGASIYNDAKVVWDNLVGYDEFNGHFSSQNFLNEFIQEENESKLLITISSLAIFISTMGLYGLVAFSLKRRVKEIGIRKSLGANTKSIIVLFIWEFTKPVLVANLIAWPVAYFVMERWLENFAYRIDLSPLIFVGSGLIALCIAWVTVGSTAAKAANQKPVLALRYE